MSNSGYLNSTEATTAIDSTKSEVESLEADNTELVESPMFISHISSWNIRDMWTTLKSYISSTLHEISDTVLTSIDQCDHHHYGSYDLSHPYKNYGLGEEPRLIGENPALLESFKYFSNVFI
ncbi:hypothetical protein [Rickettsia sp. MEAM1 (Bemisia tabaci)]|uniref:hypothetical protein n=1 Tax=Rickettsia sp. MEAM1 (Bemisia tabaci) TaxID=1182263 RepID=UPI000831FB33|nr:hypothetical protein [Rickettsia sp. MEAM1 (Bemisia tabaci)]